MSGVIAERGAEELPFKGGVGRRGRQKRESP